MIRAVDKMAGRVDWLGKASREAWFSLGVFWEVRKINVVIQSIFCQVFWMGEPHLKILSIITVYFCY